MTQTVNDVSKEYGYSYFKDYVNITKIRNDLKTKFPNKF